MMSSMLSMLRRVRQSTRIRRWPAVGAHVLFALALAWPPVWSSAQVRLPSMGDAAAEDLPIGVERRYGEQIMREVWRDPAYLDDPVLGDYVSSLWQPMLDAARRRGDIDDDIWAQFAWKTFLVRDRSVNAFALPGGYVGVHLGLIAMTASEDELASVLAHELSHVSQRHIARSLGSANRQSTASMVAMLLGVLAASRAGSADMAQAAIVGSQAAAIQGQLNFSRDMEREADRVGFGIFSEAGYGIAGMANMFDKLEQAGRLNDSGAFPYLRTHPLTVERVAEARARLLGAPSTRREPSLLHALMQARARVLMDASEVALRRQLEAADSGVGPAGAAGNLYAAALAATQLRDHSAASRYLDRLHRSLATGAGANQATAAAISLLQAEASMARGDPQAAIEALRTTSAESSRSVLVYRATGMLQVSPAPTGDIQRIDEALREWLAVHRSDALIWSLHARASEVLGRRLQSLRAQAEVRAAEGDLPAAIDRLRAAQRASRGATGADLLEASIIDARLRELEERQRAIAGPGSRASSSTPPG